MDNKESSVRKLGRLVSEIVWEYAPRGAMAISNFIKLEAQGVKRGWVLFLVILVPLMGIAAFAGYKIALIPASDLRATVIRYGYDFEKGELYSAVQFINSGKTPRTVLGIRMFYRGKHDQGMFFLTDSNRPDFFTDDSPTHIRPHDLTPGSYKLKLVPDLLKLPGEVFGLYFTTMDDDGTLHFSGIETMMVANDGALIRNTNSQSISLDKGTFVVMPPEEQSLPPNSKHDR